MKPTLRRAQPSDSEFVYQTKKAALGAYIEETWGWDEDFQRRFHEEEFATSSIQIVACDGTDVGWLEVEYRPGEVYLAGIYLAPAWQGRGIGTSMVQDLLRQATADGLAVRLQVLKVNGRARALYDRLGFVSDGETETHVQMVVHP